MKTSHDLWEEMCAAELEHEIAECAATEAVALADDAYDKAAAARRAYAAYKPVR